MTTLTTEQVAERLCVTASRVRVHIRSGRLPAQKFGRVHVVNETDLKSVENRKPGRPPDTKAQTRAKATAKKNKGGKK